MSCFKLKGCGHCQSWKEVRLKLIKLKSDHSFQMKFPFFSFFFFLGGVSSRPVLEVVTWSVNLQTSAIQQTCKKDLCCYFQQCCIWKSPFVRRNWKVCSSVFTFIAVNHSVPGHPCTVTTPVRRNNVLFKKMHIKFNLNILTWICYMTPLILLESSVHLAFI